MRIRLNNARFSLVERGQMAVETVVGTIVFFLSFYIFLTVYDPIANDLLFPILDNTAKITYGPQAKLVILIIPIILAIMGIIMTVRGMQGRAPPPTAYYG